MPGPAAANGRPAAAYSCERCLPSASADAMRACALLFASTRMMNDVKATTPNKSIAKTPANRRLKRVASDFTALLLFEAQRVAGAAERLDEFDRRVGVDLGTQVGNVGLDDADRAVEADAPH